MMERGDADRQDAPCSREIDAQQSVQNDALLQEDAGLLSDSAHPGLNQEIWFDVEDNVFSLGQNQTHQITPRFTATNAAYLVRFLSSDENIAAVSPTGLITGIRPGTAIITAITEPDGYRAIATITVVKCNWIDRLPAWKILMTVTGLVILGFVGFCVLPLPACRTVPEQERWNPIEAFGEKWNPQVQKQFQKACQHAGLTDESCDLTRPPTSIEMIALQKCKKTSESIGQNSGPKQYNQASNDPPHLQYLFFLDRSLQEQVIGNEDRHEISCKLYPEAAISIRKKLLDIHDDFSKIVKNTGNRQDEFANALGFGELLDSADSMLNRAESAQSKQLSEKIARIRENEQPFFTQTDAELTQYINNILTAENFKGSLKENTEALLNIYKKEGKKDSGKDPFFIMLNELLGLLERLEPNP
jgi:hypothetical protein